MPSVIGRIPSPKGFGNKNQGRPDIDRLSPHDKNNDFDEPEKLLEFENTKEIKFCETRRSVMFKKLIRSLVVQRSTRS